MMISRDPLAMITHKIRILALLREKQVCHLEVLQPWYTKNAIAGGSFGEIKQQLEELMRMVLACGYLLELTKNILVISLQNVARE